MSVLQREVRIGPRGTEVLDSLRSKAEQDHWILEGSTHDALLLKEPLDLGTYYPVEVRISIVEGPTGQELRVLASSEGRDLYYDNHLKRLVEDLLSRVGPIQNVGGNVPANYPGENVSDLEMLARLYQKGLLSEREFQLAKERANQR